MPPKGGADKPTAFAYEKDEKVLCFHGAFLYEAKILNLEQSDPKDKKSAWKYLVHYKGWKNTWDDWVSEDRLRKFNDENKALANDLLRDLRESQRAERERKDANKKTSVSGPSGQKKGKAGVLASEAGSMRGSEDRSSVGATGGFAEKRGVKRAREWETIEKRKRGQSSYIDPDETEEESPYLDPDEIEDDDDDESENDNSDDNEEDDKENNDPASAPTKKPKSKPSSPQTLVVKLPLPRKSHRVKVPSHPQKPYRPKTKLSSTRTKTANSHNPFLSTTQEDTFLSRPSIRIPIPDHIKGLLVDDWENITKSLQLVPLPHPHPVSSILAGYMAFEMPRRRPGSADADILEEVEAGVREYFDKSLGRILLYRFERQQYLEVKEKMAVEPETVANDPNADDEAKILAGKRPSDVYGAEHLARLFVSMPELIAQTNMDAQSVARLREELVKLTTWLGKNSSKYFAKTYIDPGQEYVEKSKGTG